MYNFINPRQPNLFFIIILEWTKRNEKILYRWYLNSTVHAKRDIKTTSQTVVPPVIFWTILVWRTLIHYWSFNKYVTTLIR